MLKPSRFARCVLSKCVLSKCVPSRRVLAMCVLAIGLAAAARAAVAAEFGSISYPPQAVFPFGAASVDSEVAITDSDIGLHGFFMNFVLPQDYIHNAKVRIIVYFTTNVAKPCNMVFEPQILVRWRAGVAPLISNTGLSAADGSSLVAFPNSNALVRKVFSLERNPAFPGGQRPGDAFKVGLGRDGGNPTDTCNGIVRVPMIEIRYPRTP